MTVSFVVPIWIRASLWDVGSDAFDNGTAWFTSDCAASRGWVGSQKDCSLTVLGSSCWGVPKKLLRDDSGTAAKGRMLTWTERGVPRFRMVVDGEVYGPRREVSKDRRTEAAVEPAKLLLFPYRLDRPCK